MSLAVLKRIIELVALYLCRPNTNLKIYELTGNKYVEINFIEPAKYMKRNNIPCMERAGYLGSTDKLKTRLILHLLPADELAKRLRKANHNNKKKGRGNLSKEYKAKAALNLFITNASKEQIPNENGWPIYRLRWQIELMFKIWKSICNIEKVKKVKRHRFECYVYSKLIFIVLGWKTVWAIAQNMYLIDGKALSFYKAYKSLLRKIKKFRHAIQSTKNGMINFIIDFYDLSNTNHLLEKRNQEPTSLEILLSCFN